VRAARNLPELRQCHYPAAANALSSTSSAPSISPRDTLDESFWGAEGARSPRSPQEPEEGERPSHSSIKGAHRCPPPCNNGRLLPLAALRKGPYCVIQTNGLAHNHKMGRSRAQTGGAEASFLDAAGTCVRAPVPNLSQRALASLSLPVRSWQMRTPSMASVLQESAPTKSQISLSMVPPPNTTGGR